MHLDWVGYMLLSRERYRLKITKQTTAKRFSLALSSKKTERSSGAESKLSFASCYPLFHQHLSARPLAADGIGTRGGGGKQEFFAACLLPISCTSPDTSSLLTSRPSSPLSSLPPPVHAPISNSTPSSLFPSDPSLTTDLRPIH